MRKAAKYIHSVTATACINQRRWFLYPFGPVWVHVWSINSIRQKVPHLQFHYISLPSPAQTTKTALACICWQIGLLAVGETLVSTQWDCIVHPPFWTNKIRVKMKSIYYCWHLYLWSALFNNQFLSRLPGGVYPLGKPLHAAENVLFSYVHTVARGKRVRHSC